MPTLPPRLDHPIGTFDDESSMSKGGKPKDVFDVERIRQIIELMEQHELCEVDLQQGDEKIKLYRGSAAPVYSPPPAYAAPVAAAPAGRGRRIRLHRLPMATQARSRSTRRWSAPFTLVPIRNPSRS